MPSKTNRPETSLPTRILAITAARTVINTGHRMVYPLLRHFGAGLGVDLDRFSLALAARWMIGAAGPFLASITDRRGRKLGMLLGLLLFSVGISLVVFWPTYPVFVLTLLLSGLGKYLFDPSLQAYLGDRVPYQRRGLALAVTELSWSLAFLIGVPLMGFLIARAGWLAPFPLLALLGLISLGMLAWLLPSDSNLNSQSPNLWQNLRAVLTYGPALAGLSVGLLMSAANETVNLVFGVWMKDSFGLEIAGLGAAAALIGLAELSGEGLVAGLADRLGKVRAIGLGLLANSLAALVLILLKDTLTGAVIGLALFYVTFEFTIVSSVPLMTEVYPAARATLMATNVAAHSLGRALGDLISPTFYAWGFALCAVAAVGFNLLAMMALRRVRIKEEG